MLIRGAEVEGHGPVDVRVAGGRVAALGARLARARGEAVVEARDGVLLPGLHDHHVHLHALAAATASLRCGPPAVRSADALGAMLVGAAHRGGGWLRGVGYHESVAGALDRERLDRWVPHRPLRIQHRSGALWIVNSAGVRRLGLDRATHRGIERDASGRPTGRLFRADAWLRGRWDGEPPDLAPVGAALARRGVTGVTDASATNDAASLARLAAAAEQGALPQRLLVMGEPGLRPPDGSRAAVGCVKALLDEARLPELEAFAARIAAAHAEGRGFAVHCVTRAELVFAASAFGSAGARPGDRLEHASVAPPEVVALVARLPLTVVTQPHFVAERGDTYLADVAPEDRPWLYRARAWLEAGVPLGGGSDAPFGEADPWRAMAAAVSRRTAAGAPLGPGESLAPEQALALFTADAGAPGGPPRRVAAGAPADLCLLDRPWREARRRLTRDDVVATWCAGVRTFDREEDGDASALSAPRAGVRP